MPEKKGKSVSDSRLRNIYLVASHVCNLSCSYCYAKGGSFGMAETLMDAATMEKALAKLLPMSGNKCTISFFGGEPMLNMDVIKAAISYGEKIKRENGIELVYAITTNGTLLNKASVSFLKSHISHVAVSLDGLPGINDMHRKFKNGNGSVYRTVIEGIRMLRNAGIPFGISATVNPDTAAFLSKSAEFLASIGADTVKMAPRIFTDGRGWKRDNLKSLISSFDSINCDSVRRMARGMKPLLTGYPLKALAYHSGSRKVLYPCAAGEGILAVSAEGDVYPCDHFIGINYFKMGNVHENYFPGERFFEVRDMFIGNSVEDRRRCKSCDIRYLCGGECHAASYLASSDIALPSQAHCIITKELATGIIAALEKELTDKAGRDYLLKFLGGT